MKRKAVFFIIILLSGIVLSGCGVFTVTPSRMQFNLGPTADLGYSATPTISIAPRSMTFSNSAGAAGLQLTGYQIWYYDAEGNEIDPGGANGVGAMNVYVPPGIRCDEPDEELGCSILDDGAEIRPGYPVTTEEVYQLLDVGVAEKHLAEVTADGYHDIHWYAEIQFTGFALDTGQSFISTRYRVRISPPS
jgi:hypothetical protein